MVFIMFLLIDVCRTRIKYGRNPLAKIKLEILLGIFEVNTCRLS
jgi:hypothetical protein